MARTFFALILLAAAGLSAAIVPDRYIVELAGPAVGEFMPPQVAARKAAALAGHRTRVHGEQQRLRPHLERRRARVLGSVDTVANAMFVELPGENAKEQLLALPGVKRVLPMREFHRVMDRAVVLHKVSDVWARIGEDRAGQGVKVAIVDTGIETSHPAFQNSSLKAPEGFPRTTNTTDESLTNGKIIVARSYVSLLSRSDPDHSAQDRVGHGTALAAIVAGSRTAGPLATIQGVAPKAWIGSYKVFGSPGVNDGATDAAILKAIDDAVGDGMDVINLSLGSDFAPRLDDDIEVQAVERATRAGVIVVVSAGNNGPGLNTLASPGTAPSAITVGAVTNDRVFAANVDVPGLGTFLAVTGSGPAPAAPITAALSDVGALDKSGLACDDLPPDSLKDRIALILRGTCTFEVKINNVQRAGAVAALVYATEQSPGPIGMSVGAATLPAEMVSNSAGVAIKSLLAEGGTRVATLSFTLGPVPVPANRRSSFSAAGPSVDLGIKPDLAAAGSDIYTATQSLDRDGDMYDPDGFVLVDGTSFSGPIVAGTVALLKSARPGLTVDQYRSLIVNNTVDAYTASGAALAALQVAGSGSLDALAALNATVAASPVSLSFGAGTADPRLRRTLRLTNLGTAEDTFFIESAVRAGAAGPVADAVKIGSGSSLDVPVTWNASGLAPGAHEGLLLIRSSNTGQVSRVAYWYAVASTTPASITVLDANLTGRAGGLVRNALVFRVLDAAGLNVAGVEPAATVLSGDGTARPIVNGDETIPGLFALTVQLGPQPGLNTFRIQAGEVSVTLNITAR